ncbi:MAG: hypothetical protein WBO93_04010, partial [Gammaproteobacteria bacterium]
MQRQPGQRRDEKRFTRHVCSTRENDCADRQQERLPPDHECVRYPHAVNQIRQEGSESVDLTRADDKEPQMIRIYSRIDVLYIHTTHYCFNPKRRPSA